MAREFPFATVGTTTDYSVEVPYTDTVLELVTNGDLQIGSRYPNAIFWGGISISDCPFAKPVTGIYQVDLDSMTGTITVDDFTKYNYIDTEYEYMNPSYAFVTRAQNTQNVFGEFFNYNVVNERTNNASYLDNSFANSIMGNGRFVTDIKPCAVGYSWGVVYIKKSEYNADTTTYPKFYNTDIQNFITNYASDPDYIIVDYTPYKRYRYDSQTGQLSGSTSTAGMANVWNQVFSNYIFASVTGLQYNGLTHAIHFQTKVNSSSTPIEQGKETYNYDSYTDFEATNCVSLRGEHYVDTHNAIGFFMYNGTQTFDITPILNMTAKNTTYKNPYTDGDNYIFFGKSTNEFYWDSVGFDGYICRTYKNIEEVLKVIASLGMFFIIDKPYKTSTDTINLYTVDGVYAPVLDASNIFHGEYTHGAENMRNDFWIKPSILESEYEPSYGGGGGDEPDEDDIFGDNIIATPWMSAGTTAGFVTPYVLSESQMAQFGAILWSRLGDVEFFESIATQIATDFSLDPAHIVDYILSVRYYPLNISEYDPNFRYVDEIILGRGYAGISFASGRAGVAGSFSVPLGYSTKEIPANYGDFRDYEPYSRCTLYVPFCGSVDLAPSKVVGKKIRVDYNVNVSTGSMQCNVSVIGGEKQYVIAVLTGQIGADVQITASNEFKAISNLAGFIGKAALTAYSAGTSIEMANEQHAITETGIHNSISGASKNPAKVAMSAVVADQQNDLNLKRSVTNTMLNSQISIPDLASTPKNMGVSSTGFEAMAFLVPHITIEYKQFVNPDSINYGRYYGYACNFVATLGSLSGLTCCNNVILNDIPATEPELNEIRSYLESGIIL